MCLSDPNELKGHEDQVEFWIIFNASIEEAERNIGEGVDEEPCLEIVHCDYFPLKDVPRIVASSYFDERYIELHDRIGKVCDIADQVNDLAVEVN